MALKVTVASALFVGYLLWQGGWSALQIGREAQARVHDLLPALRLDEPSRVRHDMARWERELRLPEGTLQDSYGSLARRTPQDAKVFVISGDAKTRDMVLSHLKILLMPRHFWLLDSIPEDWETKAKAMLPSVFILEIGPESDPRLRERATLLNAGKGFFLWEYEG
ncbi:MAG TPA: hypothetical protein ENK02_13605 [Planctomycetes bacterium]|nr:hypothetical protein [Planctomycetota bacterium]